MRLLGSADVVRDLKALEIVPGDGLFVHTALGQVGHVLGGPRGLIEALIEAVGPAGLLAMPGFSKDAYHPADLLDLELSAEEHERLGAHVPGFDPARSDVRGNGSVPEAFRAWPGVVRSPHPTSSVLLFGPDAVSLGASHDQHGWATGPETPWGQLQFRPQMKILLIGVGWNRCSAFHAAESNATHRRVKMRRFKTTVDGEACWIDAPDVADDLGRLFPLIGEAWEETGGVTFGRLGEAECRLTDYAPLLRFATDWIGARNKADGEPEAG